MWRVAEEDYAGVVVEYALLVESERLEDAKSADRQYHLAKLMAAAFNDPGRIWEEHEEYRRLVLQPSEDIPREALEARALVLLQRSKGAH